MNSITADDLAPGKVNIPNKGDLTVSKSMSGWGDLPDSIQEIMHQASAIDFAFELRRKRAINVSQIKLVTLQEIVESQTKKAFDIIALGRLLSLTRKVPLWEVNYSLLNKSSNEIEGSARSSDKMKFELVLTYVVIDEEKRSKSRQSILKARRNLLYELAMDYVNSAHKTWVVKTGRKEEWINELKKRKGGGTAAANKSGNVSRWHPSFDIEVDTPIPEPMAMPTKPTLEQNSVPKMIKKLPKAHFTGVMTKEREAKLLSSAPISGRLSTLKPALIAKVRAKAIENEHSKVNKEKSAARKLVNSLPRLVSGTYHHHTADDIASHCILAVSMQFSSA